MKRVILCMATVLAVAAILVVPVGAGAADTGETDIQGTVGATISIIVPGDFRIPAVGNFAMGPNLSDMKTVMVDSNTNWSLSVQEVGGDGFMSLDTSPNTPLGQKLQIDGGTLTGFTWIEATAVSLVNDGVPGEDISINDIQFQQDVGQEDSLGNYLITLTFTAAPR